MSMFGGTGGYFWLDSWILANIVQLGTQRFCKRFLNRTNDPCGRQFDQMTQRTAKSGKNAWREFWGCTGYPECKGVREVEGGQ